MKITKTKKYTTLKPTEKSLDLFFKNLEENLINFKDEHLILDFSDKINTELKELLLFLNVSKQHKQNGTSFVIVFEGIDIDEIPEEINVVPTFTEALDILEMEAIERDLGL
jgi:hypothetical protein